MGGTPGLVPVAMEVFDRLMPQPNQISKQLLHVNPTASDLLQVPDGQITAAGVKQNVAVGLGYLEAWLRGIGCVPLLQPNGGCGHGRDQSRAAVALDAQPCKAERWKDG